MFLKHVAEKCTTALISKTGRSEATVIASGWWMVTDLLGCRCRVRWKRGRARVWKIKMAQTTDDKRKQLQWIKACASYISRVLRFSFASHIQSFIYIMCAIKLSHYSRSNVMIQSYHMLLSLRIKWLRSRVSRSEFVRRTHTITPWIRF